MKNILPWIAAVLACAAFFGGGFLIGRLFPAHHYEHLAGGPDFMLFDTATGKPCMARRVSGVIASVPANSPNRVGDEEDAYPDVPTCSSR
jgi:hypothetical protein